MDAGKPCKYAVFFERAKPVANWFAVAAPVIIDMDDTVDCLSLSRRPLNNMRSCDEPNHHAVLPFSSTMKTVFKNAAITQMQLEEKVCSPRKRERGESIRFKMIYIIVKSIHD